MKVKKQPNPSIILALMIIKKSSHLELFSFKTWQIWVIFFPMKIPLYMWKSYFPSCEDTKLGGGLVWQALSSYLSWHEIYNT
jgi:hypothetical protein